MHTSRSPRLLCVVLTWVVLLSVVGLGAFLVGCQDGAGTVAVRNTGTSTIKVKPNDVGNTVQLGQNGIATLGADTPFTIGDVAIRVTDYVEVANRGQDVLTVKYTDSRGIEKKMLLGEGGTGFFSKSRPILVGAIEFTASANN